jgi:hypothetical protein
MGANVHVTSQHERQERAGEGGTNERHATNDDPAPAPSLASHCSQGGSRVLTATSPASTNDREGGQGRAGEAERTKGGE